MRCVSEAWTVDPDSRAQLSTDVRERRIAALADRQHGIVHHGELLALGLSRQAIQRRVAAGRLHPVHRGVYAVGRRHLTLEGRWMAAVRACGPESVLSYRDAGHLRALRPSARALIEVTVPAAARPRHNGIHVHRTTLAPEDMTVIDGIPVTSLARTLLDLAAVLRPHQLARAIEAAERRRLLDFGPLRALLTSNPRHAGARNLRAALATYTEGTVTHSDHEALLLHLCVEAGLPRPQTNSALTLSDGSTIRPDLLWPAHRLVVEIDGDDWHAHRSARRRDHARDADVQALGLMVVRVLADDLDHRPREVLTRLEAILEARAA